MKKKVLSERQKELLDMALKVIDEWKRTGDVPPPLFFESEDGDDVTKNRVRMALGYLAEVINRTK